MEVAASTPKRTRRGTAKSRDGCGRCKTRRIKCDESRPACRNCVKFGRSCPGYQQQLRWSKKYERHRKARTASDQGHVQINHHVTAPPLEGPKDKANKPTNVLDTMSNPLDGLELELQASTVDAGVADDLAPGLSTWEGTTFDLNASSYSDTWDPSLENSICEVVNSQHLEDLEHPRAMPELEIIQSPTHLPTTLIEYWFRCICPMRSTFDSEINYNRQVAWSTWSTSEAVSCSMQAMSAACLKDSIPQLREMLPSLRSQALATIGLGMSQVRISSLPGVTVDLVFAVFAMGTSAHWNNLVPDHGQEYPWLDLARELLSIWRLKFSAEDTLLYAYFTGALMYWEMLLAGAGQGSIPAEVRRKRQRIKNRLHQAIQLPNGGDINLLAESQPHDCIRNAFGTRPNSWCGVSREVIHCFGQVLALCRSTCLRAKDTNTLSIVAASEVLCDISLAHELQNELQAMDFNSFILLEEAHGHHVETQDENTPISHLLQTAEAYRQAALLQLHLTFPDLQTTQEQLREAHLLALAVQLATTLEKIPAASGSKSIHPMLYLTVAVSLRYLTPSIPEDFVDLDAEPGTCFDLLSSLAPIFEPQPDSLADDTEQSLPAPFQHTSGVTVTEPIQDTLSSISQSNMDVSRVRGIVWTQLDRLQRMLPYGSSDNVLQLVQTIWNRYDGQLLGQDGIHWLNILKETGSSMMFW